MSRASFITLAQEVECETVIKKSRFICALMTVEQEEDAMARLNALRKRHYNATHNCFAYVLGQDKNGLRASDDGEPQGTAGMPMLDVLTHSGVTNILAVVTRYFGGTLLGTGGLTRAYSSSVSLALDQATFTRNVPATVYRFQMPYADYGKLMTLASEFDATVEAEFLQEVAGQVTLREENEAAFVSRTRDAFLGADIFTKTAEIYLQTKEVVNRK